MKVIAGLLLCLMFVGCDSSPQQTTTYQGKLIGNVRMGGYSSSEVYEVEIEGHKYLSVLSSAGNLALKPEVAKPVLLGVMKGMPVYVMEVDGTLYYMTPAEDAVPAKPFNPFEVPKAEKPEVEDKSA